MANSTEITVYFQGRPGDFMDGLAHGIIEKHGGTVVGSGIFLPTSERDIGAEVPADRRNACIRALRDRGFRVTGDTLQ